MDAITFEMVWTNEIYFTDEIFIIRSPPYGAVFPPRMADGGNPKSFGCTARQYGGGMAESGHLYDFGGGYGGYGGYDGLQRPPLS